jgi:WD40 repeat protein
MRLFFICLLLGIRLVAMPQDTKFRPTLSLQTGFTTLAPCSFAFSPNSTYFYGFNEAGEYVIWDLRTAKQIKQLTPLVTSVPQLYYFSRPCFAPDEKFMVIPDFPQGRYYLYNLYENNITHTFEPESADMYYTDAFVSADSKTIMLLMQSRKELRQAWLDYFDATGKLLRRITLSVPYYMDEMSPTASLLMSGLTKAADHAANINNAACSPDLGEFYFTALGERIYHVSLRGYTSSTSIAVTANNKLPDLLYRPTIEKMSCTNGKLRLLVRGEMKQDKKKHLMRIDTVCLVDESSGRLLSRIPTKYFSLTRDERSNGLPTDPMTTDQTGDLILDMKVNNGEDDVFTGKSIDQNKNLFSYRRGKPFFYNTAGEYQPGQMNGGTLVALSPDKSFLAECTRDIIIYDLRTNNIKLSISPLKGNLKLNQPFYIDSFRLVIPKIYNDAFVLDTRTGTVDRLRSDMDCEDTARRGANTYYAVDNSAQYSMRNASLGKDSSSFILANFIPSDLCTTGDNKTIQRWSTKDYQKLATWSFKDREFTYSLKEIPDAKKFLVNYKLVDVTDSLHPQVKELIIVEKKDTFFAINPSYLPDTKRIFSILCTRKDKTSNDLMFAYWDLNGVLQKSTVYKRPKKLQAYASLVFESALSPDGKYLLYALNDGTAGLYDINKGEVTRNYEHGDGIKMNVKFLFTRVKLVDIHVPIISGAFVNDSLFVTTGGDSQVVLWSVNDSRPRRVVNPTNPVFFMDIGVSPDKRYVYGTGIDKAIRFLNLKTGETDLSFLAITGDTYAMMNSDGYYVTNKKAVNNLAFMYQGKAYNSSQFDAAYQRPDKVVAALGYMSSEQKKFYESAVAKRYKMLGLSASGKQNNLSAPEIKLLNLPDDINQTTSAVLNFIVDAKDAESPLSKLMVTVNGAPLFGRAGKSLQSKASPLSAQVPVSVPLMVGRNEITVSVMNNGGGESLQEYLVVDRKGTEEQPDLYVVTIGAGTYKKADMNLRYAAKDATDVSGLLAGSGKGFRQVVKLSVLNEKVTRENVRALKKELLKSRVQDKVIVFYAGHGMLNDSLRYFLGTYDMDFAKPSGRGLAYEELENLFDSIPARGRVLFIDACQSGDFDKDDMMLTSGSGAAKPNLVFRAVGNRTITAKRIGAGQTYELMKELFADVKNTVGATVISSAGGAEVAWEGGEYKNGLFTYALLSGLKEGKADRNGDGMTYLSELMSYLQEMVPKMSDGRQHPTSRVENIVNDLRIW